MVTSSKIRPAAADKRQLTDHKRELIRQVIIDRFSGSLFQDVGIRDICSAAGVTPKTIYKHFGNKEALLIAAIEPDMKQLNEDFARAAEMPGTAQDRLAAIGRAFFHFYFDRIAVARIIFLNIPSAYFVSHPSFIQTTQLEIMRRLICEGQSEKTIRRDIDADDLVEAMAGVAMRYMYRYLTGAVARPSAQVAADHMAQIARPLITG